ncbi:MAG: transposase [Candidatus Thiodiazotropha sp.]
MVRYTHRIAITNGRILKVDERGVKLRYKDYADNNRTKVMNLKGEEFVRRYLLHVLPNGFTRIRHYGFLAGCCHTRRLAQIREALALAEKATDETNTSAEIEEYDYRCPLCKTGYLRLINEIPPEQEWAREVRRR